MRKIVRNKDLEQKAFEMLLSSEGEIRELGTVILEGYIKSYKHFTKFRDEYLRSKQVPWRNTAFRYYPGQYHHLMTIENRLCGHALKVEHERRAFKNDRGTSRENMPAANEH